MKVAAIVPAYNEEQRISRVLEVLCELSDIDEVIVVDDGSEDNTSEVALSHGVKVIKNEENLGKGGAMQAGIDGSDADILLFIDADLVGLKDGHITDLLEPVKSGRAEMSVGVFTGGRLRTDISQRMFPFISGQRAVKRSFIESMNGLSMARYGVELAITKHAKKMGIVTAQVLMDDVTQVMKEEKLGVYRGVWSRLNMYKDMALFYVSHNLLKLRGRS